MPTNDRQARKNAATAAFLERNPGKSAEYKRSQWQREWHGVLEGFGEVCACCGEIEPAFLELHHRFGGGKAHREALGCTRTGGTSGTIAVYVDFRRRGYPRDEAELLCANCHRAVTRAGECPHQPGVAR